MAIRPVAIITDSESSVNTDPLIKIKTFILHIIIASYSNIIIHVMTTRYKHDTKHVIQEREEGGKEVGKGRKEGRE